MTHHKDRNKIYIYKKPEKPIDSNYSYRRGLDGECFIVYNNRDFEKFTDFAKMMKKLKEYQKKE